MLTSIKIRGIRSFKDERLVKFSVPNGKRGSGLTIIVGPNNSGKSTLIESIHQFTKRDPVFEESFRNKDAPKLPKIVGSFKGGIVSKITLESTYSDSATVQRTPIYEDSAEPRFYIVSSQKRFSPFFSNSGLDKINHSINGLSVYRDYQPHNQQFGQRLIDITNQGKKKLFDTTLSKILPNSPEWQIDVENHNAYIKFIGNDGVTHNSMNSGDGIVNLFSIVDALHDPNDRDIIVVIDEPEISLHPDIQRNVMELILEESRHRQIILATHSPYMVEWESVINGGHIYRFVKTEGQTECNKLGNKGRSFVVNQLKDLHNVRTLGIEAKEIFFLNPEKTIIVPEGQDDVTYLYNALKLMDKSLLNTFSLFGWGAGGSNKIVLIQHLLSELGYKRVIGFFDTDQKNEVVKADISKLGFLNILSPAKDIRKKKDNNNMKIEPLILKDMSVNSIYKDEFNHILEEMISYAGKGKSPVTHCNKGTTEMLNNIENSEYEYFEKLTKN